MKRVEAITDANAQSVQKYGYASPTALVALKPETKDEGRESADGQLVGYVHAAGRDGRWRRGFFHGW
jgi:hypothetical protein